MGGNVFENTSSIKKEDIKGTLEAYFKELSTVFPNKDIFSMKHFVFLGSTNKAKVSGDIDLGLDISKFCDYTKKGLSEWGVDKEEFYKLFDKLKKRARTSNDEQLKTKALLQCIFHKLHNTSKSVSSIKVSKRIGVGGIFTSTPLYINGVKQCNHVQIDWMVGDINLLLFSYHSDVYNSRASRHGDGISRHGDGNGNIKGLHRTQLLLAMFRSKGLSFSHNIGLRKDKTFLSRVPAKMLSILSDYYHYPITLDISNNYHTLMSTIKQFPSYEYDKIINIYLLILDRTRVDIPNDIQHLWKERRIQLGLKGRFLPKTSQLSQSMATKVRG